MSADRRRSIANDATTETELRLHRCSDIGGSGDERQTAPKFTLQRCFMRHLVSACVCVCAWVHTLYREDTRKHLRVRVQTTDKRKSTPGSDRRNCSYSYAGVYLDFLPRGGVVAMWLDKPLLARLCRMSAEPKDQLWCFFGITRAGTTKHRTATHTHTHTQREREREWGLTTTCTGADKSWAKLHKSDPNGNKWSQQRQTAMDAETNLRDKDCRWSSQLCLPSSTVEQYAETLSHQMFYSIVSDRTQPS